MKIIMSLLAVFFIFGCSGDDEKKSSANVSAEKEQKTVEVKKVVKIKPVDTKKVEEVKAVKKAKKVEKKLQSDVEKPIKKEVVKKVETSSKSGKEIFSVCGGCHGMDGSKSALGRSKIIKGWDAKKVVNALHGYKAGTYGGSMKGLMKGQVLKLNESEINTVAHYVSGL